MRLLFLTHRVPFEPNRGDRIRAYHMLRHLQSSGVATCLVALAHDREEIDRSTALAALAERWHVVPLPRARNMVRSVAALASERPLTHVLLDSPRLRPLLKDIRQRWQPDVVLAYCSGMARFALEAPLRGLPFVLDMVDLDSEKWAALGARPGVLGHVYRRESRLLSRFERTAVRGARRTLVVNERERVAVERLVPGETVDVVPNGVDIDGFRAPADSKREAAVVFTGVFSYEPNAAAAAWLATEVWPIVRRAVPPARLYLVGSGPPKALTRLPEEDPSITVTGVVTDVRPYLWRSCVAAAPLFVARGLQNKVLEALAAGLPVVTTSAVASGLPAALAGACSVADTTAQFADSLIERLRHDSLSPPTDLLAPFSWPQALENLVNILREAAGNGCATGAAVTPEVPLVGSDA